MKLTVGNLSKEFTGNSGEKLVALDDINLDVAPGEFVSVVGPSGCGKSTLLEIIAGLQPRDSGEIFIDGLPIEKSGARCAIVFQQYALFPWLNVRKNVEYGPKVRGVAKKTRREISSRYLEMVGLSGFEKFYPHELSGGMQQRVALARALANAPDILLLDEPFAALDAQTKENCQRELLEMWRQTGLTILFVTHDVGEAIFLSDRVVVMSKSPGTVVDSIAIQLERPRELAVRMEERFRRTEQRVRAHLSESSSFAVIPRTKTSLVESGQQQSHA